MKNYTNYTKFLKAMDERTYDSRIGMDLSCEELRALGIQDDVYRRWDEDLESSIERLYY